MGQKQLTLTVHVKKDKFYNYEQIYWKARKGMCMDEEDEFNMKQCKFK